MSNAFGRRPHIDPTPDVSWGRDQGRAAKHANPATNQVERPLTGAPDNNRGVSKTVLLPANGGVPTQVNVGLIAETPKDGGADAEDIVVTCFSKLEKDLGANDELLLAGLLEWGIGGAFFTMAFDWRNGLSFPICASVVRVKGLLYSAQTTDNRITLSAGFGYGSGPKVQVSPLTATFLYQLGPGVSTFTAYGGVIGLPPFGVSLTLQAAALTGGVPDPAATPSALVTFYGFGGQQSFVPWTPTSLTPIPIPGWAYGYAVTNTHATKDEQISAIFALAI